MWRQNKMLVDAMTMRMTIRPESLDTIVASNLHADICPISRRLWPARSGSRRPPISTRSTASPSMFEPIHGSAFDIAGKGIANPIGSFWTGARCSNISAKRERRIA